MLDLQNNSPQGCSMIMQDVKLRLLCPKKTNVMLCDLFSVNLLLLTLSHAWFKHLTVDIVSLHIRSM